MIRHELTIFSSILLIAPKTFCILLILFSDFWHCYLIQLAIPDRWSTQRCQRGYFLSYRNKHKQNFSRLHLELISQVSFYHQAWYHTPGVKLLNIVMYGKAPPWGPTPYPFIHHFWQKRLVPLSHTFTEKSTPFTHLQRLLQLFIHFNCCKCTALKYEYITKPENVFSIFHSVKCISLPCVEPRTDRNNRLHCIEEWNFDFCVMGTYRECELDNKTKKIALRFGFRNF